MKGHLYKYTVEHIEDAKGNPLQVDPLIFKAKNHDDLFKIIELMKDKKIVDNSDAVALAIGLKLFGEVMLKNRDKEVFKELMPHFSSIMKEIKSL